MEQFTLIERDLAYLIEGGKSEGDSTARELGRMLGAIVKTIVILITGGKSPIPKPA